jgi:hypothetical protein
MPPISDHLETSLRQPIQSNDSLCVRCLGGLEQCHRVLGNGSCEGLVGPRPPNREAAPSTSKEMLRKGVGRERGAAPLLGSQGDDHRVLGGHGPRASKDAIPANEPIFLLPQARLLIEPVYY